MLFILCISIFCLSFIGISLGCCSQRFKRHMFLPFIIVTLCTSGCSVSPESSNNKDNNDSEDLKSISERIMDWVNTTETEEEKTRTSTAIDTELSKATTPTNLNVSTKNSYLEQEAQLMRGVSTEVIATYKQAVSLMKQQSWQAALALFDQVIVKEAHLSGSYVNKALIFKYLSEQTPNKEKQKSLLNQSERLIDTAIDVNSKNPYAHYVKGQLMQTKGNFEQAEKNYFDALLIWPNYAQAQLSMAVLLELYRGKLVQAEQYYRAYLLNHPEDQQVKRWQAALTIKIKRSGLSLPTTQGE